MHRAGTVATDRVRLNPLRRSHLTRQRSGVDFARMASTVVVGLDTTPPTITAVSLAAGAAVVTTRDVNLAVSLADSDTTGYEMKIYGDVDDANAPTEYRAAEGDAPWVPYTASRTIRLASGDGLKTVRVKTRDEVQNESGESTDTSTLDETAPTMNVTVQPDRRYISEVSGRDQSAFSWQPNEAITAYKVKVVPATNSPHTAGTQIPTAGGSTNVSGGAVAANATVVTTVDGTDLKTADPGDGDKIIKVFGQDAAGNWNAV